MHDKPGFKMSECPLCRAMNMIYPGSPPGKGYDYHNRCSHRALTGHRGMRGKGYIRNDVPTSWRQPARGSKLCGFPLTKPNGDILPPLPFPEYRAFTKHDFDVKELTHLVLSSAGL